MRSMPSAARSTTSPTARHRPRRSALSCDEWRREIDRLHRAPETPIGRELARAASLFELPLEECHALLDGMETDSSDRVRLARR